MAVLFPVWWSRAHPHWSGHVFVGCRPLMDSAVRKHHVSQTAMLAVLLGAPAEAAQVKL